MGSLHYWDTKSSSDSSNSILQMMSKIRLSDSISFFFLYTLLQINYGWEYQWHIITILFLVFELCFQSKPNYLIQFFYRVFPHNDYPCFLIFNSNPTHIQDDFFFFLFQQQRKRLIFLFGAIEFAEKVKSLTVRINQWFNFVSLTRINPSQHLSANSKPCWTSYCED